MKLLMERASCYNRVMIQDIEPKVFYNQYEPVSPRPGDPVFVFMQKQVMAVRKPDSIVDFPTAGEFIRRGLKENLQYLFRIDDKPYFLFLPDMYAGSAGRDLPAFADQYEFIPLTEVRKTSDMAEMFACMTGFHLHTWYDKNRFCGRCGKPLTHSSAERMLRCSACGNMVFPMIAPAVIVGVTNGEQLLMTKYAGRAYTGWALIAGFCEIGERVEDTVRREVLEEAGVHVKNLRYVDSQPWGVDSNLLIGMFCEVDGDTHIHMDREELSRAVWVDRADVPDMKDNHSLTGYMIELFRTGREQEQV